MILRYLAAAAAAYLLGSISTGVLLSRGLFHDDVRQHGSGGTGATNMLRTFKLKAALATFAGDAAKAAAAVLLGRAIAGFDGGCVAAVFVIVGHMWPLFFGFRGGKGVLVGAGAALATEPWVCLALLVVFLIEFAITRIVSLGSIIIAVLYPVVTLCYWAWKGTDVVSLAFITVCCALMGIYVVWLHRSNIQRLKNGTEYRFGEKKKENQ